MRLEGLLQKSFLVDYTFQAMNMLLPMSESSSAKEKKENKNMGHLYEDLYDVHADLDEHQGEVAAFVGEEAQEDEEILLPATALPALGKRVMEYIPPVRGAGEAEYPEEEDILGWGALESNWNDDDDEEKPEPPQPKKQIRAATPAPVPVSNKKQKKAK